MSGLYYGTLLPRAGPLDVGYGPEDDLVHQVAGLRSSGVSGVSQIFKHDARLRSVAWSPAGCSARNSPLLTTADTNGQARLCGVAAQLPARCSKVLRRAFPSWHADKRHARAQVHVYEPPEAMRSEWGVAADLSAQLLSYLGTSGWRVRAHGAACTAAPKCLCGTRLTGITPCPFVTHALVSICRKRSQPSRRARARRRAHLRGVPPPQACMLGRPMAAASGQCRCG